MRGRTNEVRGSPAPNQSSVTHINRRNIKCAKCVVIGRIQLVKVANCILIRGINELIAFTKREGSRTLRAARRNTNLHLVIGAVDGITGIKGADLEVAVRIRLNRRAAAQNAIFVQKRNVAYLIVAPTHNSPARSSPHQFDAPVIQKLNAIARNKERSDGIAQITGFASNALKSRFNWNFNDKPLPRHRPVKQVQLGIRLGASIIKVNPRVESRINGNDIADNRPRMTIASNIHSILCQEHFGRASNAIVLEDRGQISGGGNLPVCAIEGGELSGRSGARNNVRLDIARRIERQSRIFLAVRPHEALQRLPVVCPGHARRGGQLNLIRGVVVGNGHIGVGSTNEGGCDRILGRFHEVRDARCGRGPTAARNSQIQTVVCVVIHNGDIGVLATNKQRGCRILRSFSEARNLSCVNAHSKIDLAVLSIVGKGCARMGAGKQCRCRRVLSGLAQASHITCCHRTATAPPRSLTLKTNLTSDRGASCVLGNLHDLSLLNAANHRDFAASRNANNLSLVEFKRLIVLKHLRIRRPGRRKCDRSDQDRGRRLIGAINTNHCRNRGNALNLNLKGTQIIEASLVRWSRNHRTKASGLFIVKEVKSRHTRLRC